MAAVLVGAVAGVGGPAHAQATLGVGDKTQTISDLQAAQLLVKAGRLDDANKVLLHLTSTQGDNPEVLFLLGSIAMSQNDPAKAVHFFRRILVTHPDAVRVRLELGRAFFAMKDYDNAARQFRLALAADLPAAVRDNIQVYLNAIRLQRQWTYNLSVALAPDSDINAGPSVQTVAIFGLPFQLSSQSREHSGVGVTASGGGEWTPHLGGDVWFRAGGEVTTSDYRQIMFDDTTVSTDLGLRFIVGRWDISPVATYFERWYGGSLYNRGSGASLQATDYVTQRLAINGAVSAQYLDYKSPPGQSGPSITVSLGAVYTLSSKSFLSGQVSLAQQWAQLNAYANTAVQMQVGYYRDLPRGFTVSVQPSLAHIAYASPLAAFPSARTDNLWSVQATLLNRRLDWYGFTPRLAYTYTLNDSNLPLYGYRRNRLELGVTRSF